MGLYIKGVEMPQCKEIVLRIDEKGEVYVYGTYPTELHEAVPVPPHGRLIDADALEKVMSEGIAPSVKDGGFTHPFDIIRAVANAPTVIPESESKEYPAFLPQYELTPRSEESER